MDEANTVGDLARDALTAYEGLLSLGEDIEDEWSYVNDLSAARQARIEALIDEKGASIPPSNSLQ